MNPFKSECIVITDNGTCKELGVFWAVVLMLKGKPIRRVACGGVEQAMDIASAIAIERYLPTKRVYFDLGQICRHATNDSFCRAFIEDFEENGFPDGIPTSRTELAESRSKFFATPFLNQETNEFDRERGAIDAPYWMRKISGFISEIRLVSKRHK